MGKAKGLLKEKKIITLTPPSLGRTVPTNGLLFHCASKTATNTITWIYKTSYQPSNIQGNNCSLSDHVPCLKCVGVGGEALVGKPLPEMAFLQSWQLRRGAMGEIGVLHGALSRIQVQATGIFSLETPSKRQTSLPGTRCLWLVTKSCSQSPSDASFFCEHACGLLAAP